MSALLAAALYWLIPSSFSAWIGYVYVLALRLKAVRDWRDHLHLIMVYAILLAIIWTAYLWRVPRFAA